MKRWLPWIVALVVVAVLGGFVARAVKLRHREAAAAAPASAPPALELGRADVFTLQKTTLTRTLPITGSLKAVTSAVVKARVAAEVQTLTVREGDPVKQGQVVGRLDTTEYDLRLRQAEQTAVAARTQLDIARRALENNRALVAQGFISSTALQTSIATEAGAQASYQAALAAADIARKARTDSTLVAPIDGIVSQRFVQPGERVGIDAKVIEIVDLSRIELEAAVAPEDVGAVQVGQSARLDVDGLAQPARATVARINPSTQPGTRAVLVYLAVQPQPGLRQGLFARGRIELQRLETTAAPVTAVRVDQARPYVLAVEGGQALRRPVELGVRGEARFDDDRDVAAVEIVSGAAAGATLLRGSAGNVRDGTPVTLAPAAPTPRSNAAAAPTLAASAATVP